MINQLKLTNSAGLRATEALNRSVAAADAGSDGEFASVLADFAKQSVATMREGERAAVAGITGQASIQEVVDKVMAAEQALQSTLAIRDKVVAAWLEISRINI